ncbi:MAG: sigma-70 family RNA polymerase sigma factor [Ruminococcus sp.]|nr:sigma-70 family RNA polymerase sigma factor [Ruminococcus sp.]MCM1480974.1 sigma-70 family RNA polymerase sigma factor [Muribaculaceae bacterium]
MRVTSGDFPQKYDRYGGMIFKIAMTYMGNTADAEDVTQEVFMRLLYKSPEFESSEHEKRWLIRATANVCKDILKRFDRRFSLNIEDVGKYLSVPFEYENAELLFSLKREYRIVLYLKYYDNYSVEEIADILSISVSAVKMRLKRGRDKLKLELENEKEDVYEQA